MWYEWYNECIVTAWRSTCWQLLAALHVGFRNISIIIMAWSQDNGIPSMVFCNIVFWYNLPLKPRNTEADNNRVKRGIWRLIKTSHTAVLCIIQLLFHYYPSIYHKLYEYSPWLRLILAYMHVPLMILRLLFCNIHDVTGTYHICRIVCLMNYLKTYKQNGAI